MPPSVLTIGHSNHPLDRFLALLAQHEVEALVDIRRFPGSIKHPHFHRDNLAAALQKATVEYHWLEALGGRRHKQRDESANLGLENKGFRNYADYMLSPKFEAAIQRLVERAERANTAIMCAESVFFRCHRMLVSDYLVSHGHSVLHIVNEKAPTEHMITKDARIIDGKLVYRGDYLL